MWNSGRRAATLIAAGVATLSVTACGHTGNPLASKPAQALAPPAPIRGAACRDAVITALGAVAKRIYAVAQGGPNAVGYAHLVEQSPSLRDAVIRRDPTATRAALMPLLARQLVHVRVTSGATLLADVGKPNALAPLNGVLRDKAGDRIGAYTLAVQDDRAYVSIMHGITPAEVLLRSGRRQLLGTLSPGPARIPDRGHIRYRAELYEALSFNARAYPNGKLRISLLVARSQIGPCLGERADTIAATLGAVGRRIYQGEVSSGKVMETIKRMKASGKFRRAVARSDKAATLRAINGFFRLHQFHIVRARVLRGQTVLADLGGPYVLGPSWAVLLRDRHGHATATFLVAVQDDAGYVKLAQRFTGAEVIIRRNGRIETSTLKLAPKDPPPTAGETTIAGRSFRVFSFTATAFPSGPLNISLLYPAA